MPKFKIGNRVKTRGNWPTPIGHFPTGSQGWVVNTRNIDEIQVKFDNGRIPLWFTEYSFEYVDTIPRKKCLAEIL